MGFKVSGATLHGENNTGSYFSNATRICLNKFRSTSPSAMHNKHPCGTAPALLKKALVKNLTALDFGNLCVGLKTRKLSS